MAAIDKSYSKLMRHSGDFVVFTTVYREKSLSRAAKVLGISQPSLSKRVQNLERSLGHVLFERTSRGLNPTSTAKTLWKLVEKPVEDLRIAMQSLERNQNEKTVLVSVDFAFAALWLLPILPEILDSFTGLNIQILSSQTPHAAKFDTDITIHLTDSERVSDTAVRLLDERVSAVASPSYVAEYGLLENFDDIGKHKLIHLTNVDGDTPWYDWETWLLEASDGVVNASSGTTFNSYEMVLKSACAGQGIVLGWHGLIDKYLQSDELVLVRDEVLVSGRAYFMELGRQNDRTYATSVAHWIERAFH
jgi:DNA-binding transcriptional LysR family regulator